ncbi:MAG: TolC family protein [Gemmatimonadetes bacterium]|nr:TolC family protein [Gemmatimonadota bacterium]MXX34609.1 TolC family protein [Gemmatimonadota bacterium]MYD11996.1 TolC family protein [Gemmatimonadota bacterium]MYI66990.1 TolC family protein [Gemmatimonadota bacterium]
MYITRTMAVAFAIAVPLYIDAAPAAAQTPSYTANGDPALAALIAGALEGNPRVRGSFLEYQAARARISQASTLPNPAVSFTQHLMGAQTRVGPQLSNISVSQALPWFGTLSDRREIAAVQSDIRNQSYAEQRAEVIRHVKLAWYDLAYLDQALRITEEEEQLLLHYEALAQARYSQGFGQQQEVVKLQAEVTRVLNRRQELLRQRTDFEAALNVLANRPVDTPVPPVEIGERPAVDLDEEALHGTGLGARPEVRSARLRIESGGTEVRLARRRYRPDFTVGVAWGNVLGRRDEPGRLNPPPGNGRDTYSLTFGASVPVFRSSYDAGVREAAARLSAAEEAYQDAANGVAFAVRSTAFRLTTIEGQLALFEDALLPQAEQALSATEEAYSAGVTGVLELLDSEEMLLDVRLGLARLQADYMKALAEMERAIGSAFPEEGS